MIKTCLPWSKGDRKQAQLKKRKRYPVEPKYGVGRSEFALVEHLLCAGPLLLACQLLSVSQSLSCHYILAKCKK